MRSGQSSSWFLPSGVAMGRLRPWAARELSLHGSPSPGSGKCCLPWPLRPRVALRSYQPLVLPRACASLSSARLFVNTSLIKLSLNGPI